MKKSKVPVLIVGAGAAGTMLTLELARRGVNVRTVDRLPKPADTSRAITLHARTLEILERIDKRLVDRFIERGIHNKGYVLHFVDAAGKRSEVRPGIDFTTLDSRYNYLLVIRQNETEQYLREYTSAHYGVAPDWGTACVDVRQDANEVVATLESAGVQEEVHCQYLVGCDGQASRVRSAIRSEPGEKAKEPPLQALDAFLNGFPDADDHVHYCAGADHVVTIVQLPNGYYRLLRDARGEAAGPGTKPEQGFMQLVGEHFDGVTLGDVVSHSAWHGDVPPAPVYRTGRVFLAGDSAQVHPAAGGQGVNCCLQDAYNLGWKLAFALKKYAHASLLDTYETERRGIAAQALSAAASLQEILTSTGQDVGLRARDPNVLEGAAHRCSGLSYTYRDHADVRSVEPSPAVGDRAPDVALGSGRTLFDLTRHPSCTLLALPAREERAAAMQASLKALVHRFARVVELRVVPPSPAFAARYGAGADDLLLLLRPDGYVGFRCRASDVAQLEARLHEWFAL